MHLGKKVERSLPSVFNVTFVLGRGLEVERERENVCSAQTEGVLLIERDC